MWAQVGLTLTAAQAVIFGELVWTPGELIQAEDRAHRIGQTRGLTVYYLIAVGTCDEGMWQAVKQKLQGIGQAMDGHTHGTALGASPLSVCHDVHFFGFLCTMSASLLPGCAPLTCRIGSHAAQDTSMHRLHTCSGFANRAQDMHASRLADSNSAVQPGQNGVCQRLTAGMVQA